MSPRCRCFFTTLKEPDPMNDLGDIHRLPIPIVTEILSRLSIKNLFTCLLVCKSWAAHISTPEFAKLHLSRSPTKCLIKPFSEKDQPERLNMINLDCTVNLSNNHFFITNYNLPMNHLYLTNSCHGLVCLYSIISSDVVVCNPVLGEYITIPKPTNIKEFDRCCSFAFGFSHITGQYKVLLGSYVDTLDSDNYLAHIYRLGEGSWRSIESVSYQLGYISCNAFSNGAVHWIGHHTSPIICSFDFVKEEFCAVPEPSEFGQYEWPRSAELYVGVINENLSIYDFCYVFGNHVIIWVMKHYGVKESWSKDFVITLTNYDKCHYMFEPIMVNGNGEIFMIINDILLVLYDPKSGDFGSEHKILDVISISSQSTAHVPSLISLKDVAKGENLKVLGRN